MILLVFFDDKALGTLWPYPTNSDGALMKHSEEALGKKRPSMLSW